MTTRGPIGVLRLAARLFSHISRRRRIQFGLLLALTLAGSVAEVVSLGAVVPFIGALTQPERIFASPSMAPLIEWLGITSSSGLLLPLTIAFAVAAIIAGTLRVVLLWVSTILANATGADLSVAVYRRTLYQPYPVHVARNSSEIISGMTQKVAIAASVLMSLVTVVTSLLLFVAILATLFAIDPTVAALSAVVFGSGYALIAVQTRGRLRRNSVAIATEQTAVVRSLQEGLGAIRDVLLDGTQDVYGSSYERAIRKLQRATGENSFITLAPRFAMETLGLLLVAGLAFYVTQRSGDVGATLPILGAMGIGAQRLLPLLQQLYGNWSVVMGGQRGLLDVMDLLEQPLPDYATAPTPAPLAFSDRIKLDDIRFRYDGTSHWVLDGITLDIPRGARVGLVGQTGSGKSTILDLVMMLLSPSEGRILVDGRPIGPSDVRAWQRTLAHVPQSIYLADASIAENIAFGVRPQDIDMERVQTAARQAQLAEFVEARPEGYAAIVGERGVRLSGGQRQRIGIARALYKQASVLIFDEATSALDGETEAAVMDAVRHLDRNLTILMVAHRITTLQHCDTIVQLERGRIRGLGSYQELLADSQRAALAGRRTD
jgi:ATP-binding cassette, subfamily B, bacterial PglK